MHSFKALMSCEIIKKRKKIFYYFIYELLLCVYCFSIIKLIRIRHCGKGKLWYNFIWPNSVIDLFAEFHKNAENLITIDYRNNFCVI